MLINVNVTGERPDSYTGKKGVVNQIYLSCLDAETNPANRLVNTFDYAMSEEEKGKYAGKIADKRITLAVTDFTIFGGRLRARGRIVEAAK